MIKELVGQEIRKLRTSKGYSQEKFATICGLDRTYVAAVERGKRNISIENLYKIANALEITMSELFNFGNPIQKTILLDINGERFILESKEELTREKKMYIETICQCAYDEDSTFNQLMEDYTDADDLIDLNNFQLAGLFQKVVKNELGIDVIFKAIDLEVRTEE